MSKQVVYLKELPKPEQTGSQEIREANPDLVKQYLLSLIEFLHRQEGSQFLLPSIAEIAQHTGIPRNGLWEGLHHLKAQDGVDWDFQSGYYGSMIFTPKNTA